MRLRSVLLRNWKTYRRAQIELPTTCDGRNVVVFEGYNGAGKTSLLEAIQLCLFGRSGLALVARAAGNGKPESSYDDFLERAMSADSGGKSERISITLEFAAPGGGIALERIWHFSASGRHRAGEEEVRILAGPDLEVVPLPAPPETDGFVRDLVAKELLPRNLAPFFLIDGEQLDHMAGKGLEEQVRCAVDAVLGAPALRNLAADLRAYARERRKQLPQGDGITAAAAEELVALETSECAAAAEVDALVQALCPLRFERDAVVRRIGALHGESYASFKTLFEERERIVRGRDAQQDELRRLLSGDVAMALSGQVLRRRAIDRIAAEDRAERWESGSAASRSKFGDYLAALKNLVPNLPGELASPLAEAWDQVWSDRPSDCATEIKFRFLGEADRRSVAEHLERLSSVRSDSVAELARAVAAADRRIAEIEREIARQRGVDDESQSLADSLAEIQERIATAEATHQARVSDLERIRARAVEKRSQADIVSAAAEEAGPALVRARRADRFAEIAERLIDMALPANLDDLSNAVTSAYRAMAHKSEVERVQIKPDGTVLLLDGDGSDLRQRDTSAGESQIFALSLMSALADLAGDFPIIMDTPLARLDPVHRKNVLEHFSRREGQLILLAHPAELGAQELKILDDRIAGTIVVGSPPETVEPAPRRVGVA